MREQRGVRQHLVVHVRVEVGHLHDAVEREHPPETGRLEQHHFLVLGAALLEHVEDVVGRVRRAAGLELLEALRLELRWHTSRQIPTVDPLGCERLAQHVDDRLDIGSVATGEEVGGEIAVLGPGVKGEMTLRDHRDARHALGGELVHEHLDERDPAGIRGVSKRPLGDLDRVEVRRSPELADRVPSYP